MEIVDEIQRALTPYIEANIALNRKIDKMQERIDQQEKWIYERDVRIARLKDTHIDSGLKRDIPVGRLWAKKYGRLNLFCPICEKMVSNWEPYCCVCGQRLDKGNPRDEDEVVITDDGRIERKA